MTADEAMLNARRMGLMTCLDPNRIMPISYEENHYGVLVVWPSGAVSILIEVEAVDQCLRRMIG